jgi:hypothetical protein
LGYVGRCSVDEGCCGGREYGMVMMKWLMGEECVLRDLVLSIVEHEEVERLFPIQGFLRMYQVGLNLEVSIAGVVEEGFETCLVTTV